MGKEVTKKWRNAKSDETGICIRFSCGDNSSCASGDVKFVIVFVFLIIFVFLFVFV